MSRPWTRIPRSRGRFLTETAVEGLSVIGAVVLVGLVAALVLAR